MFKKRGMFEVWGLIFGFIFAFAFFYPKMIEDQPQTYVGESSYKMLRTASEAEKALFYIDQSAKYSAEQAVYDLAKNGGFNEPKCGVYLGYSIWNSSCFPDHISNFKSVFNKDLNSYLYKYAYADLIEDNYDIVLNGNLEIKGIPAKNLFFDVTEQRIRLKRPLPLLERLLGVEKSFEKPKPENVYPQPEPGEAVPFVGDKFRVTQYYTAHEDDFTGWSTTGREVGGQEACNILISKRGFYEDVKCEGSGITREGLVCQYTLITPLESSKKNCLDPSKGEIGSRGKTAAGTNPEPGRTIAVDESIILLGTKVYLDFGYQYPEWNGCYTAEDTGSAIKGRHIDLYVGVGKKSLKDVPSYAYLTVGCDQQQASTTSVTGSVIIAPGTIKEEPFVGEYFVAPSFKTVIDYDLNVYEKLKSMSNEVIKLCKSKADIEKCVESNKENIFNNYNLELIECETKEQEIFDNFLDYFMRCEQSNDKDCFCSHSLGKGKFEISKEGEDILIRFGDLKYNIGKADIYYEDLSLKKLINFDLEKSYLNKGKNGELIILPKDATPKEAHECSIGKKSTFKFCIYDTKKQFYAYDENDKEIKLRNVVYKFALSFGQNTVPREITSPQNQVISAAWIATTDPGIPVNLEYYGAVTPRERSLGTQIEKVVLHHTAGSTALGAIDTWAKNGGATSAHYVIDKDGTIYYVIDESKRANHAGCYAESSSCTPGEWCPVCEIFPPSADNDNSIGIEIVNKGDDIDQFTDEQYKAINSLLKSIEQRYPTINHVESDIIAHCQITKGKIDPAPNFAWNEVNLPSHEVCTV